ncbi:MAG: nicotinate phosphoribosyltransferase, partial [Ignavibacteriales bacterium]|nr:nicotinate phosphoribosyltransferase [Ignavibacteriales bacterium]
RVLSRDGSFYAAAVGLAEEQHVDLIFHPFFPENRSLVTRKEAEPILHQVMENGEQRFRTTASEAARHARERLARLSPEHKRFENPHVYKVGISKKLMNLRSQLVDEFHNTFLGGAK